MYIIDDYREAYSWLRTNTDEDSSILSWWDYGYQIAGMADRATVVDNNTWNNTHIALVGKFMASDEKKAHALATQLGMKLVKVHRCIRFDQSDYLRTWVNFCTARRSQSKDTFSKNFWKSMVNIVFGT